MACLFAASLEVVAEELGGVLDLLVAKAAPLHPAPLLLTPHHHQHPALRARLSEQEERVCSARTVQEAVPARNGAARDVQGV